MKCNTKLHFSHIKGEKQCGLASVFYIQCQGCKTVCNVATDTHHRTSKNEKHYDTNTKAIIGKYIFHKYIL